MGLIDPATWAGFAGTSLLIELTPGPNMAYLAVVAASHGRKLAFATVFGVALGLLVVGMATALGLAAIINASPFLYHALRVGGVAYLLWLAWDGWRAADTPIDAMPALPHMLYFRRGLVTNLLNPKAAVFYVAVLPTFVDAANAVVPQTLLLSLTYVTVATLIHVAIVVLAGTAQVLLQDQRRSRIIRRSLAAALALVALWFAWDPAG